MKKRYKVFIVIALFLYSIILGTAVRSYPTLLRNGHIDVKSFTRKSSLTSFQITVSAGWNLISVPLIVPDPRAKTLFPSSISGAFGYDGKYFHQDTMQSGVGYWLKFAAPETVTITGEPDTTLTLTLRKGWNMIGSSSIPVPFNQLVGDQCIGSPVVSRVFLFDGHGYYFTDTIVPGRGAWVKAPQAEVLYYKPQWVKVTDLPLVALTPHPTEQNVLFGSISSDYTGGTNGAILRSTDAGASWDTLVANVDGGNIVFDPKDPSVIYAGLGGVNSCSPGIIKSTDAGQTWFRADSGIVQHLDCYSWAGVALIDPNNTSVLYASAGGIDIGESEYKSTNGGVYWFPLKIYYASNCTLDTAILQSEVLGFAMDPENSDIIYAGTAIQDSILYWSTNGGASWEVRHCFSRAPGYFQGISRIFVNPADSNNIFVGGYGGFFRSGDRGLTWETSNNGLEDLSNGLLLIPTTNANIFYGQIDSSFYRTFNGGVSWERIVTGSDGTSFRALDEVGKYIYVKTREGIMRMKICI